MKIKNHSGSLNIIGISWMRLVSRWTVREMIFVKEYAISNFAAAEPNQKHTVYLSIVPYFLSQRSNVPTTLTDCCHRRNQSARCGTRNSKNKMARCNSLAYNEQISF